MHTAEERSYNVSVAAVAPKRDPLGDKMPGTSCRLRLLLCERLSGQARAAGRGGRIGDSCHAASRLQGGATHMSGKTCSDRDERAPPNATICPLVHEPTHLFFTLPAVSFVRRGLRPHEPHAATILHVSSVCVHACEQGYIANQRRGQNNYRVGNVAAETLTRVASNILTSSESDKIVFGREPPGDAASTYGSRASSAILSSMRLPPDILPRRT